MPDSHLPSQARTQASMHTRRSLLYSLGGAARRACTVSKKRMNAAGPSAGGVMRENTAVRRGARAFKDVMEMGSDRRRVRSEP